MPQPQSRIARVGTPPAAAGDERLDEPPEAAEPEMIAFGARRGFEQAIHRRGVDDVLTKWASSSTF